MKRNGFFGVKNSYIAPMTDEDAFTYGEPVHVPGTVEIKMEPSRETATSYADNEVWIKKTQDNGGSGTMSFYDTESSTELRQLFADIAGYDIDDKGRVLGTSGKEPKPFAFMCEQPGHVIGKRRCFYKCRINAPSVDAKTLEDKPDITQLDYDFSWQPVTLPTGWRGSHYDSFSDCEGYDKFFDAVDIAVKPKAGE